MNLSSILRVKTVTKAVHVRSQTLSVVSATVKLTILCRYLYENFVFLTALQI
nr:MAG TPA: hypothetical protein [Caudoviricetes sp.]